MRLFYILLVLLTFSFLSCQKDHISEIDGGSYIEPSEQNDPHVVTGIITSENGDKMNDVSIKVYQEGELVGEVTSDVNGYYSTDGMPLDPSKQFTLEYFKPDFNYKYRRVEELKVPKLDRSLILSLIDENEISPIEKLSDPSDSSYVKVYGYCNFSNGNPIKNVSVGGAWEFRTIGDKDYPLFEFRDRTGNDGYFEGLVPKGEVIHLFDWYYRYPNQVAEPCYIEIIDKEKYTPIEYPFDNTNIGILSENHQVFTNVIEEDTYKVTISGRALSCNGTPLSEINIKSSFVNEDGHSLPTHGYDEYQLEDDGSFFLEFYTCDKEISMDKLKIKLSIVDNATSLNHKIVVDYQENIDFGNLNICTGEDAHYGSMNLNIENQRDFEIKYVLDRKDSGTDNLHLAFYEGTSVGNLRYFGDLNMDAIQLGIVPVSKFFLYEYLPYKLLSDYDGNGIIVEITDIENDYVTGIISGTVLIEGEERTIDGDFYVYNK